MEHDVLAKKIKQFKIMMLICILLCSLCMITTIVVILQLTTTITHIQRTQTTLTDNVAQLKKDIQAKAVNPAAFEERVSNLELDIADVKDNMTYLDSVILDLEDEVYKVDVPFTP